MEAYRGVKIYRVDSEHNYNPDTYWFYGPTKQAAYDEIDKTFGEGWAKEELKITLDDLHEMPQEEFEKGRIHHDPEDEESDASVTVMTFRASLDLNLEESESGFFMTNY